MAAVIMSLLSHADVHSQSIDLPNLIHSEDELDQLLSRPSAAVTAAVRQLRSPLLVLGASGKMGPSLCALAKRAAEAGGHKLEVIAVSRFSDRAAREWLDARGVRTIPADLLERRCYADLPDSATIVYLVGLKFGTQQNPSQTWAVNTLVPSHVAERYPDARIVALSTGNVYPFVSVTSQGATEKDMPAPVGDYASAALARERLFEYHSRKQGTPMVLLRLNYAVDLRYGVLVDIAQKVWNRERIDLSAGYLNCIWQGDANDMILRSFDLVASPPAIFNLTGSSVLSVRELARRFGELLGRPATLVGSEADTALLSNSQGLRAKLGDPPTPLDRIMEWTAHWIAHGGKTLGKPTHFDTRTGQF
jgi:nucleoside-diphosphate-sugar epimerase